MSDRKRKQLEAAAKQLIEAQGLVNVMLSDVCGATGMPAGSFAYYAGRTFSELMFELQGTNPGPAVISTRDRIDAKLLPGHLVNIAVNLAIKHGYRNITRSMVAEAAGVSPGTSHRAYPTLDELQRDVMLFAVAREVPEVVAQGIALSDPFAINAADSVKRKALKWLRTQ